MVSRKFSAACACCGRSRCRFSWDYLQGTTFKVLPSRYYLQGTTFKVITQNPGMPKNNDAEWFFKVAHRILRVILGYYIVFHWTIIIFCLKKNLDHESWPRILRKNLAQESCARFLRKILAQDLTKKSKSLEWRGMVRFKVAHRILRVILWYYIVFGWTIIIFWTSDFFWVRKFQNIKFSIVFTVKIWASPR
jgi:hypothetical protein